MLTTIKLKEDQQLNKQKPIQVWAKIKEDWQKINEAWKRREQERQVNEDSKRTKRRVTDDKPYIKRRLKG